MSDPKPDAPEAGCRNFIRHATFFFYCFAMKPGAREKKEKSFMKLCLHQQMTRQTNKGRESSEYGNGWQAV
jgi:hypothetical protein